MNDLNDKQTFGAYVMRRRRELGMTQKEFAEKLYVTESAVSKWERGLSYPDITLLMNICSVLDISEHELLTGSEDTQKRASEQLAARYLSLMRRCRVVQYVLYGGTLLGCAIGNLAAQHTLDWFFIVLTAVLMAASLTLLPVVTAMHPRWEPYRPALALGGFTLFLEALLLACCLYTGGSWFPVAATAVLFGAGVVFLPFLLPSLPLPACLAGRKASACLLLDTALLLLLLGVCCLYTGGSWFWTAAAGVVFGLSFFIVPVLLYQLPLPAVLEGKKISVYLLLETLLLLLLLAACCFSAGGDWFVPAAVGVVFGLGFALLPVLLRQLLPEPLNHHKALVYFGIQTLFLFVLLLMTLEPVELARFGVPIALLCLPLPWGLLGLIRYLPVNGWYRAGASAAWTGLWVWLAPFFMDRIMDVEGEAYSLRLAWDFSRWDASTTEGNVLAIVLFSLGALALLLTAAGLVRPLRKRRDKEA